MSERSDIMVWSVARVAGLAVALGVGLAGSAAQAQQGVAIKNVLGDMGILPKEKDPIRYRERAPLVLPPRMELRAPAAPETFASANPEWPKDPDVMARKRRADETRNPVTESMNRRMAERDARLTPEEMRIGRDPSAAGPVPGSHRGDNPRDLLMANPSGEKQAAAADPDTPVRRTLTDPPTAMRRTANGGAAPTSYTPKIDQQAVDASPMAWLTRKFQSSDE